MGALLLVLGLLAFGWVYSFLSRHGGESGARVAGGDRPEAGALGPAVPPPDGLFAEVRAEADAVFNRYRTGMPEVLEGGGDATDFTAAHARDLLDLSARFEDLESRAETFKEIFFVTVWGSKADLCLAEVEAMSVGQETNRKASVLEHSSRAIDLASKGLITAGQLEESEGEELAAVRKEARLHDYRDRLHLQAGLAYLAQALVVEEPEARSAVDQMKEHLSQLSPRFAYTAAKFREEWIGRTACEQLTTLEEFWLCRL